MRAVVHDRYGPPDVLRLVEVPTPTPGSGEVLVEVVATSVNLSDWECLIGKPLFARVGGLRAPKRRVLGSDIAGVVAAVGAGVTGFAVGDEVFTDDLESKGGFAEYAVVRASKLAHKPPSLSFEQASAIPQSAAIAMQGVDGLGEGDRLLINGGGGGSGSFAIPLAKRAGAHVTAVDNAGKLDFMRELGAEEVVDHRVEDFTRRGERYDLILDLVGERSVRAYRRALAPGGEYRWVGGSVRTLLRVVVGGFVAGRLTGRRIGLLAVREGPDRFVPVAERCANGELDVHIARTFPLEEVPDALAFVGEGRALGKVVVRVR